MLCSRCHASVPDNSRFCPECGEKLGQASMNSLTMKRSKIVGNIQQAGRDIYNFPEGSREPDVKYEATPLWRSPITQAILTWISFFTGLGLLGALGKAVRDAFQNLNSGEAHAQNMFLCVIVFVVLLIVFAGALSLRRIMKNETRHPIGFNNLAINGEGHRLTLEKIRATCPCGGKLKYINVPVKWIDHYSDGKKRREITKREPSLVCNRNPDHKYSVDIAENKKQ